MIPPGSQLVCVPGLGLNTAAWRPTIDALGATAPPVSGRVALLPAFGLRPSRGVDLRPVALAERLVAQWLGGSAVPAVLMGHSASCQIVAHAARLAPDRVAALVLVGPTTDPRAASWPRLVQRWLRTAAHEKPSQAPVLAQTYTKVGPVWMLKAMDAARRDDICATLAVLGCPVLVVRGRADRICPTDWAQEVARTAPAGSRAVTLERGAHMVPLTHGAELATALREASRTRPDPAPRPTGGSPPDRRPRSGER